MAEITARQLAEAIRRGFQDFRIGNTAWPTIVLSELDKLLAANSETRPCPWCGQCRVLKTLDPFKPGHGISIESVHWWECSRCAWGSQTYKTREEAMRS